MGSQESSPNHDDDQTLPIPPIIQKLRNNLKLNIVGNKTSSFINGNLAQQLKKTAGSISRAANPFCTILIQKKQTKKKKKNEEKQDENEYWVSCCLISPVIAIASPLHLLDENSKYCVKAIMQGMNKKNEFVQVGVQKVQIVQDKAICLLVLEKPIIELGWAGITCLQKEQQITNEPFRIINHPRLQIDQVTKKQIYHQEITKGFYRLEEQFVGSFKTMPGSLIVKIIDKKPYVVGVQVSENQGHFINKQILDMISQVAKKLINKNKEMQCMRMIDIQELQFMQKL